MKDSTGSSSKIGSGSTASMFRRSDTPSDRTVGRPDIQGFVGALHGAQADRGVFITTSKFSTDAYSYAEKVNARVILIDGVMLANLMVEHNIGAEDAEAFVLKRLDEDFFEES